jgi:hypothetical protein
MPQPIDHLIEGIRDNDVKRVTSALEHKEIFLSGTVLVFPTGMNHAAYGTKTRAYYWSKSRDAGPSWMTAYEGAQLTWIVAKRGQTQILNLLLEAGAPTDGVKDGKTALQVADENKNVAEAKCTWYVVYFLGSTVYYRSFDDGEAARRHFKGLNWQAHKAIWRGTELTDYQFSKNKAWELYLIEYFDTVVTSAEEASGESTMVLYKVVYYNPEAWNNYTCKSFPTEAAAQELFETREQDKSLWRDSDMIDSSFSNESRKQDIIAAARK